MFSITEHIVVCLAAGLLMAVLLSGFALVAGMRLWSRRITPLSAVAGGVLAVFLWFQATLFCGGLYARGYVSDVGHTLSVAAGGMESMALSAGEAGEGSGWISRKFARLVSLEAVSDGGSDIRAVTDGMRSGVHAFLWRRAGWMALAFVLTAAAVAVAGAPMYGGRPGRADYRRGGGRPVAVRSGRAPRRYRR